MTMTMTIATVRTAMTIATVKAMTITTDSDAPVDNKHANRQIIIVIIVVIVVIVGLVFIVVIVYCCHCCHCYCVLLFACLLSLLLYC